MIFFTLAVLLGDLAMQLFPQLPSSFMVLAVSFICILITCICKSSHLKAIFVGLLIGIVWSYFFSNQYLNFILPKSFENKPLELIGYIKSIPKQNRYGFSFIFHLTEFSFKGARYYPDVDMMLSIPFNHVQSQQNKPIYRVAEKWRFTAKIKRIHGLQSPGAFDYEQWAFSKGLRMQGRVIAAHSLRIEKSRWFRYPITQIREYLKHQFNTYAATEVMSPWILALMIGEREMIPTRDWDILRKTGTNHLMAIAGLHVGLLAHAICKLSFLLWRRSIKLMQWVPAQEACLLFGLIGGISYALLSGFLVPTQRAGMMLFISVMIIIYRYRLSSWYPWSFALLFVLFMNPLTVLSDSFWLSFVTIALIIYGMRGRLNCDSFWWKWGRVQWVIAIGLIPITLLWYQECSFSSVIANVITIPWLEFMILPTVFLAEIILSFNISLAEPLMRLAQFELSWLWVFLEFIAGFSWSSIHFAIASPSLMLMMMIGFIFLLLPAGIPGRWLGIIWIMPALLPPPDPLKLGDFNLTILDVGQGLSAVVQTKQHVLLYDAGAGLDEGFNAGQELVMPFLYLSNIKQLDMVMISHGDNDHAGGLSAVMDNIAVKRLLSSEKKLKKIDQIEPCLAGQAWHWDGVTFEVLYPSYDVLGLGNDSSCVLAIYNDYQRVILPGDIEKFAENLLLDSREYLKADILIAPHHGSLTSSSLTFLNAVQPQYAIFSTGYLNRYRLPHHIIVNRYNAQHIKTFNTVDTGTMTFNITNQKNLEAPECYRQTHKHYWQRQD